jgi:hypothetical protein
VPQGEGAVAYSVLDVVLMGAPAISGCSQFRENPTTGPRAGALDTLGMLSFATRWIDALSCGLPERTPVRCWVSAGGAAAG